MPRFKETLVTSNAQQRNEKLLLGRKYHHQKIGPYHVGEHVVIVGKPTQAQNQSELCKYVVKITDLYEQLEHPTSQTDVVGKGDIKSHFFFVGKYYYFPSDVPKKFWSQIPEELEENELFLSTFTEVNSMDVILNRCVVVQSFDCDLIRQAYRNGVSIDRVYTFLCRYQFVPWNIHQPFITLNVRGKSLLSDDEDDSRHVGWEYQADIPALNKVKTKGEFSPSNAAPSLKRIFPNSSLESGCPSSIDQSFAKWQPKNLNANDREEEVAEHTFLIILNALKFALGSIVYAWQWDINCEIRGIVTEHLLDGHVRVNFSNSKKDSVIINTNFVRGLLSDEECLSCLHYMKYNYSEAIRVLVQLLNARVEKERLAWEFDVKEAASTRKISDADPEAVVKGEEELINSSASSTSSKCKEEEDLNGQSDRKKVSKASSKGEKSSGQADRKKVSKTLSRKQGITRKK